MTQEKAMSELRLQLSGLGGSNESNGGIYGTNYAQFTDEMVRYVSGMVTEVLKRSGYNVIVPDDKIVHVMTEVYKNQSPGGLGDIYSRFIIDGIGGQPRDDIEQILDKTIEIITSQVRDTFDSAKINQQYSVWNSTILDENNALGIRRYSKIKLRNRGYDTNLVHMRY